MIRKLARALLLAACMAAVMLSSPPARAANHSGAWDVYATPVFRAAPCPKGFLCKLSWEVFPEPNYGQALKEARELTASGWRVLAIVQER